MAYEWLVVAGARAKFKGLGTIKGEGKYGLVLTAIGGQIAGGRDVDRFWIRTWDINTGTEVHDNQAGTGNNTE